VAAIAVGRAIERPTIQVGPPIANARCRPLRSRDADVAPLRPAVCGCPLG
jgi:hypothetical protein